MLENRSRSQELTGEVSLANVSFSYPQRPDHRVLQSADLTVKPGEAANPEQESCQISLLPLRVLFS